MIARAAAGLAIAGLVLAGCADKVSGHVRSGGAPPPAGPSTGTQPSGPPTGNPPAPSSPPQTSSGGQRSSPRAPTAHLSCPNVVDVAAHLSYACVNNAMTPGRSTVWPFKVERPVDVNWTMDEGSGDITRFARGKTPAAAAQIMTARMLDGLYGTPAPKTTTVQNVDVAVGSVRGRLIQTLITINPGYAKANHLRVKQERLWIVVVPVARGKLSGWYTSVPDLARGSWPSVPTIIKGLRVG